MKYISWQWLAASPKNHRKQINGRKIVDSGTKPWEGAVGEGMSLKKLAPYVDRLLKLAVKDWEIENPEAALPDEGRPLVFIAAHGPLFAPTPMILILAKLYKDRGLTDLVAGFYPHPMLMRFPGMKALFGRIGTPTDVYDLEGLVERLKDGRMDITGTGPEGIHCHFSWSEPVGPFDNGGMVAAAILAGAPVCLLAHRGGEAWHLKLNLPFGLTVPFTGGLRGVYIPLGPIRRIRRFVVSCRRYEPDLTREELSAADDRKRRLLVGIEIEKIRYELNRMMEDLNVKEAGRS